MMPESKIREEVMITPPPARIRYVTTDDIDFDYRSQAVQHQAWLDSKSIVTQLPRRGDFRLIRTPEEAEALFRWESSGDRKSEIADWKLPCWVRVRLWVDQYNYRRSDNIQLSQHDLAEMLKMLTPSPNLEDVLEVDNER